MIKEFRNWLKRKPKKSVEKPEIVDPVWLVKFIYQYIDVVK